MFFNPHPVKISRKDQIGKEWKEEKRSDNIKSKIWYHVKKHLTDDKVIEKAVEHDVQRRLSTVMAMMMVVEM